MDFCQDHLIVETLEFSEKNVNQGEGGWILQAFELAGLKLAG